MWFREEVRLRNKFLITVQLIKLLLNHFSHVNSVHFSIIGLVQHLIKGDADSKQTIATISSKGSYINCFQSGFCYIHVSHNICLDCSVVH